MTDLDGKNILGVLSEITELTYLMLFGFKNDIQGRFAWSAQSRVSEFENRMPMRSRAKVSGLKLIITNNESTNPTLFALRKSKIASVGINVITDETLDAIQLRPAGGQTGTFSSPAVIQYEQDDYICFKYREIDPNFNMNWQMQCKLEFEPI